MKKKVFPISAAAIYKKKNDAPDEEQERDPVYTDGI